LLIEQLMVTMVASLRTIGALTTSRTCNITLFVPSHEQLKQPLSC
jgi:hypothetical protein